MKKTKSILPVWGWVVILILLLQIGKLAYRNDWFKADKTIIKEPDPDKLQKLKERIDKERSK